MAVKADLDWATLDFGFHPTDMAIVYRHRDGAWDPGRLTDSFTLPLHIAATALHYGQAAFEGLKAFETADGRVLLFRWQENAARMRRSAEKTFMAPVPDEMFYEAISSVIRANRRFIPPPGSGASLYIRPLLIGSGPQVGVKPALEYLFVVFVTPVGPYFKSGFKPVRLVVEEEYDRAAPNGVGDVKVAGNYAAGLRASMRARKAGYTEVLYLDAREKRFVDESGPANFFGITRDGRYVTPRSGSILPSITNKCLMTLASDIGLPVEQRPVPIEEIRDFAEAGCCGTAAIITPVGSIDWRGETIVYGDGRTPGEVCVKLYDTLRAIQEGREPDRYGWTSELALD